MRRTLVKIVVVLCLGVAASGCATSRGVFDVQVPDAPNPQTGQPVKLTEVVDKRVFELDPRQPSIPSLKNNEIEDASITKRAIARKRNGFGAALGDILLPEGRTVEQVTKEALTRALHESGYRVVSEGEPGYAEAVPLQAEIRQFWAWMNPGFWQITLKYNAQVMLRGNWPLNGDKRLIEGSATYAGLAAAGEQWREVVNKGVDDFIGNLKNALQKPPA